MSLLPSKFDDRLRKKISEGRGKSLIRLLYVLLDALFDEQLSLRAASLVYTTLLALVPLLTVSFALLKAFGVNTQLEITLYYLLEPLGEKGTDVSYTIIKFVEHMNVAVLGAVGLSTLMYTVISAISKMESALNSIWHVSETRHLGQRFTSYLSIVIVGPVFGFTAVSIMLSMKTAYVVTLLLSMPGIGSLAYAAARAFPYLLTSAAFTLLYLFLPNTRVKFRSALTGGLFSALSWGFMGWAFTSFVVSSSQYSAIYSGLAALFLFVMWLYWNWLILLAGAKVAYYDQHPGSFRRSDREMTEHSKERAALGLAAAIARNFYAGKPPMDASSLSAATGVPRDVAQKVISTLLQSGLIAATEGDSPRYLYTRDPATVRLAEVIAAARRENGETPLAGHAHEPRIEEVLKKMDEAVSSSLSAATVKDLLGPPDSQR